jgi:hypothetical protein
VRLASRAAAKTQTTHSGCSGEAKTAVRDSVQSPDELRNEVPGAQSDRRPRRGSGSCGDHVRHGRAGGRRWDGGRPAELMDDALGGCAGEGRLRGGAAARLHAAEQHEHRPAYCRRCASGGIFDEDARRRRGGRDARRSRRRGPFSPGGTSRRQGATGTWPDIWVRSVRVRLPGAAASHARSALHRALHSADTGTARD